MRKPIFTILLLGIAALSFKPARAELTITPFPSLLGESAPLILDIAGSLPKECNPQVVSVQLARKDVTVRLATARTCGKAKEPFALRAFSADARSQRWTGAGIYRIFVLGPKAPDGSEPLLGFRLVEVGSGLAVIRPESGFWWNEQGGEFDRGGPGLGVHLERQGETLAATVTGYAEDGRPEWLFGAAPIEGRTARIELMQLSDGAGPFSSYRKPASAQAAGILHLEFINVARAVAWFERTDPVPGALDVAPMSLVRFRFGENLEETWLGDWVFLGSSNEPGIDLPLQVRFERIESAVTGFTVYGSEGVRLECEADGNHPNSPPPRCGLYGDGGRLLADFEEIGLDHLQGWQPNGGKVTGMRYP